MEPGVARSTKTRSRNVRWGSIATELGPLGHVRSAPASDRIADIAGGPVRASSGTSKMPQQWPGIERSDGNVEASGKLLIWAGPGK